jgi:inorganic pyrophosphatase
MSLFFAERSRRNFDLVVNRIGEQDKMINYLELPIGERAPEVFRAVIEIPKDGTNKFEYDKELHVFKLDRNLHSPVHYPGDYGFIPSTLSDDGDPLSGLRAGSTPHRPPRNARPGRPR